MRGLVLAGLFGPSVFGAWTLFRIAGRYLGLAELGIRRGMEFEVSRTVEGPGSGRGRDAVRFGRAAVGYLVVTFGAIGVLALVASFIVEDPLTALALRVLAFTVLAERLWYHGLAYMRSTGSLRGFALLEMTGAALQLALSTALALRWGLAGAIAGFALAILVGLMLLLRHAPFRPFFSAPTIRSLLVVGMPVGLTLGVTTILVTVDRLVVAAYGGTELLGYYGFAVAIAGAAASGSWVVRTVVFPDVYRTAARVGGSLAVSNLLRETVAPFAVVYPVLLGLAALFIGPTVELVVPQYLEAVSPARLLIFVGATAGFANLGSIGLVAVSRQRVLPLLAALAFVLNLGFSTWFLAMGLGIESVAAVSLVSRAAYGAAVLSITASASEAAAPRTLAARFVVPTAYCVMLVLTLGFSFPGNDWRSALISAGVYALLVAPLLYVAYREARRPS